MIDFKIPGIENVNLTFPHNTCGQIRDRFFPEEACEQPVFRPDNYDPEEHNYTEYNRVQSVLWHEWEGFTRKLNAHAASKGGITEHERKSHAKRFAAILLRRYGQDRPDRVWETWAEEKRRMGPRVAR